ncbi:MAG: HAMP domain-containing histidine kinase [Candidatus Altiarchaeota archaeon]|nr:HAMP domain-containing histidine kinase [Candidatus Altiarchaeota archaeon]
MFSKLFNWLVKRMPYTSALVLICFTWAILVTVFGALLVIIGARENFEVTGTRDLYLMLYFGGVSMASTLILIEYSILRVFGIRFERKEFTPLNDNIVDGHFRENISDDDLVKAYYALVNLTKWKETRDVVYAQIVVFGAAFGEWLISGQLMNVPIIFVGSEIAVFSLYVYAAVFHDTITSPARRECKLLMAERGIPFKETPMLSLRTKSRFFIALIGLALLAILILIKPFNPLIVVLALITLAIVSMLNDFVSKSIQTEFEEIKESAHSLAEGKKALFFSGSSDREMFDLTQSLNKTAGEITDYQRSLKEKINELEEYMSVASHDLQQPLATIQAYTQILKVVEQDDEKLKKVKVVESQADFMREMLNDLLEYSRAKKTMEYEEVKLHKVLEEIREHLKVQIQEKEAKIIFKDIPETIIGQPKRIEQLFLNLIGNAIKYSDKPIIEAGCTDREQEYEFYVKDNGRGIEQKYHEKIFKPFWKLGKEPGTGMGLAICKTVVENHGGKIWIESTPGKGSTFKFTIPKKQGG